MLTPEEFKDTYPPDNLSSELPDRPVTGLRDIQYLYGRLYTLATAGGDKYAAYLTPDAADDLVDQDDSLIVVRVDLSGNEPKLADDDRGPVWVTRYTNDRVQKVAHCKYPAARGIDHSITHQAGRNSDPEKLARYAKERLTKWPTDDVVQQAAESHEDGDVIKALATLGNNDDALETIEQGIQQNLGGPTTALLTVQVKRDPGGAYRWPGEMDPFLQAMRERKLSKLVSKGQASDSAGTTTDLVTGEQTRTVGTAEDPLKYYLGKQMEKFPGLDPDEAWRSHPISEDAAVTVMNAETFIEACTYSTFGATVYYLPYYLGKISPEKAYDIYELLYAAATEKTDYESMTPVEHAYRTLDSQGMLYEEGTRLRFYVAAVMKHQMSRYDVFGETLNGTILSPVRLSQAHRDILTSTAFRQPSSGWTSPMPTYEDWDLLRGSDLVRSISTGWYFAQTFREGDDDTDASADDPRIQALVAVLSGDQIPVEMLLESYVERLLNADTDRFPSFRVASQFAQLCALAKVDPAFLMTDDEEKLPITDPPTYNKRSMAPPEARADGGSVGPAQKLESFIEDTPALADNDQRRGVFLLGALVGAVGEYQDYYEDRSTTLIDQYPVKSVTGTRIKKITQEAVGKTLTYTRKEKKSGRSFPGTKFSHIIDELREYILSTNPDDWALGTDDLRFYYALGVTYGMNDRSQSEEESSEPELTESA